MFWKRVRKGGRVGLNSLVIGVTVEVCEKYGLGYNRATTQKDSNRALTDERSNDWPHVIRCPAKPNNDEELPLIKTHSYLLDLGGHQCALVGKCVRIFRLTAWFKTLAFAS
jgi:hypothetical protein